MTLVERVHHTGLVHSRAVRHSGLLGRVDLGLLDLRQQYAFAADDVFDFVAVEGVGRIDVSSLLVHGEVVLDLEVRVLVLEDDLDAWSPLPLISMIPEKKFFIVPYIKLAYDPMSFSASSSSLVFFELDE